MRIGLLLFAYSEYFKTFSNFHLDDIQFYVAAVFLISAAIIFIAGFMYKPTIVVLSGLAISLIAIYNIIDRLDGGLDDSTLIFNVIIVSIALFFLSNPNK